jgi:hypothetical protein
LAPLNSPTVPAAVQNDPAKYREWFAEWSLTNEGRAWRTVNDTNNRLQETSVYYSASVDKDGTFSIDDVNPGNYRLTVDFGQQMGLHAVDQAFAVPAASGAANGNAPVDLGVLKLERN